MNTWFWIFSWFLSIVAITGNGFIIFLVLNKRQLRTKTNAFVISLAVADLFVGLSAVPSLFFCELATGCNSQAFLADGMDFVRWPFVYASVINLCSLVLDRYIAIVKPLQYLNCIKRERVILMLAYPGQSRLHFSWLFAWFGVFRQYLLSFIYSCGY